jgi:hypothetical protein
MIPARSQREVTIICPEKWFNKYQGITNHRALITWSLLLGSLHPIYLPAVVAAQVSGKFDSLYPNHISFPSDPVLPNLSTLISPIFQANPCLSSGYPHRKNNKISKLRIISRSFPYYSPVFFGFHGSTLGPFFPHLTCWAALKFRAAAMVSGCFSPSLTDQVIYGKCWYFGDMM